MEGVGRKGRPKLERSQMAKKDVTECWLTKKDA